MRYSKKRVFNTQPVLVAIEMSVFINYVQLGVHPFICLLTFYLFPYILYVLCVLNGHNSIIIGTNLILKGSTCSLEADEPAQCFRISFVPMMLKLWRKESIAFLNGVKICNDNFLGCKKTTLFKGISKSFQISR